MSGASGAAGQVPDPRDALILDLLENQRRLLEELSAAYALARANMEQGLAEVLAELPPAPAKPSLARRARRKAGAVKRRVAGLLKRP